MAPADVAPVAELLGYYASQEILLWREPDEIARHLADFLVAVEADTVIGCVALRDYGGGLEELRSLAVRADCHGRRIGALLVRGAIRLALRRQGELLFALTRRQAFFERLGFHAVKARVFPEKVWQDCRDCRLKDNCNEVAVCLELLPGTAEPEE